MPSSKIEYAVSECPLGLVQKNEVRMRLANISQPFHFVSLPFLPASPVCFLVVLLLICGECRQAKSGPWSMLAYGKEGSIELFPTLV